MAKASGEPEHEVFLSYSRADGGWSVKVRRQLAEAGLTAFLDRTALAAGKAWQPELEKAIGGCGAVVVLLGPRGIGDWQHREIQLALDRQADEPGFPVIPVLLPGLDDPPIGRFLGLNTWVDLRADPSDPREIQRLVAGVQRRAIDAVADLVASLCPYRGLHPFREEDAGLFFGREADVARLVEAVDRRSPANVVTVIGRSGSGKSSSVFAGLVPELRQRKGRDGRGIWSVLSLVPGDEPLHALIRAFDPPPSDVGLTETRARANAGANSLRTGEVTVAELARDRLRGDNGTDRLLLIVDQWEELYTFAQPRAPQTDNDGQKASEVVRFIDLVLSAARDAPVTVVVTVRADFYDEILTHEALTNAVSESLVPLGPIDEEGLIRAIEGPAEAVGFRVSPDLTGQLLKDVGLDPTGGARGYDAGKLPLLEFALKQVWRTARDAGSCELTPDAYLKAGGLAGALQETAEAEYKRLSPAERDAARRLFVSLVAPGEGREDTRARAPIPDDPETRAVVQAFSGRDARLLVTDAPLDAAGTAYAEVSHEALIRHWDRLKDWVKTNRETLRRRDRLRAAMALWKENDEAPKLLLQPGFQVEEGRALLGNHGDVLIDDLVPYLQASIGADEARRKAERRKMRRRVAFALSLAAVAVMAAMGLGFQWKRADAEAQRALAQESWALGALADIAIANGDAVTGMLLALRGVPHPGRSSLWRSEDKAADPNTARERTSIDRLSLRPPWAASRPFVASTLRALFDAHNSPREVAVLSGHDNPIHTALFGPDGRRLMTASMDAVRMWDAATDQVIAMPRSYEGVVIAASLGRDGLRVVTKPGVTTENLPGGSVRMTWPTGEEPLQVWDVESGKVLATLHTADFAEPPSPKAWFSPDGRWVVTASLGGTVRVWNAQSGELVGQAPRASSLKSVSIDPEGRRIVISALESATVWDLVSKETIADLRGHKGRVRSAAFAPDGRRVVTASDDGTARVWGVAGGKEIAVLQGHEKPVVAASFSPGGHRVVTASFDGTARLWDAASGMLIAVLRGHVGGVHAASFSPDGQRVVTVSRDGTARVWKVESTAVKEVIAVLRGFQRRPGSIIQVGNHIRSWAASFTPDGRRVVTASRDGTARVWDAGTGDTIASLQGYRDGIVAAAFDAGGQRLVTTSRKGVAQVWNAESGEAIATLRGEEGLIFAAALDPDGRRVVTTSTDQTALAWNAEARVWNAESGELIAELRSSVGKSRVRKAASFEPGGRRVVAVSTVGTARVWDAESGEEIAVVPEELRCLDEGWCNHTVGFRDLALFTPVEEAAFAPTGRRLITVSGDNIQGEDGNVAAIWDTDSWKLIAALRGHEGGVTAASFSLDGRQVATASWDRTARVWDAQSGKELAVLRGHGDVVRAAAFDPGGGRVVTVSDDGTARIWDAGSGKALAVLTGHEDTVIAASFSADGQRVVTASLDGTARVWWIGQDWADLVQRSCEDLPRDLTQKQIERYGLDPHASWPCRERAQTLWPHPKPAPDEFWTIGS